MGGKFAILFNLEMDASSVLLSSNVGWVEEFAKKYEKLWVVSTHIGEIPHKLSDVQFFELGGGTIARKIYALIKLTKMFLKVLASGKKPVVFHHMSHRTAVYPGILFKFLGSRQIMWYSHLKRAKLLNAALHVVDYVVTPTLESFPIENSKVKAVGQAIKVKDFNFKIDEQSVQNRHQVLSVGRISPAKQLEGILIDSSWEKVNCFNELVLAGPVLDENYLRYLKELSDRSGWKVKNLGPVKYDQISTLHKRFTFYFMGTPKAIDRAAIEACCSGLIPVSSNLGLMYLTGMEAVWSRLGHKKVPDLLKQLEILSSLSDRVVRDIQFEISRESRMRNDIVTTTRQIFDLFAS